MTVANNIITAALNASGITGVGQSALAQDVSTGLQLLNDMILSWQTERLTSNIPGTLPLFPDLTTDVPFWDQYDGTLFWNLFVRLRVSYALPQDDAAVKLAQINSALLQANNKQFQPPALPGVSTTPQQIIYRALRFAGRINDQQGVYAGSWDVDEAFSMLVDMLAQWSRERWLVFDLSDVFCMSTGAVSYSIGMGGSFSVARPDRIESAFVRLNPLVQSIPVIGGDFSPSDFSNQFAIATNTAVTDVTGQPAPYSVDYALDILESREDFNFLSLKGITSFPQTLFYDDAYPMGQIYIDPIPMAGLFEIHLSIKATLPSFTSMTQPLGLPPEYNQAMIANLACQIMAWNGQQPTPYLLNLAAKSLRVIRGANAQVPRLQIPNGIPIGWQGMGGIPYGFGGVVYPAPAAPASGGGTTPTQPTNGTPGGIGNFAIGISAIGS